MEEIEVGDYVRTDKGVITHYSDKGKTFLKMMNEGKSIFGKAIKHSKNLIDLIEVGDYVNEKKVVSIREGGWGRQLVLLGNNEILMSNENSIKSIVTKEQFINMEYKVGE